jgi:hypothetical protein
MKATPKNSIRMTVKARKGRLAHLALAAGLIALPGAGQSSEIRVDGRQHVVGYNDPIGVRVGLPEKGIYTFQLTASDFRFGWTGPVSPYVLGFCPAYVTPAGNELFSLNGLNASKTIEVTHGGGFVLLFFLDYDGSIWDNSGGSTVTVTKPDNTVGTFTVDGIANTVGFFDTKAQQVPIPEGGPFAVTLKSSDFKFGNTSPLTPLVLGFCPAYVTPPGDEVFVLNGVGTQKRLETAAATSLFLCFIDYGCCTGDNSGGTIIAVDQVEALHVRTETIKLWAGVVIGQKYELRASTDLVNWDEVVTKFVADSAEWNLVVQVASPRKSFRLLHVN